MDHSMPRRRQKSRISARLTAHGFAPGECNICGVTATITKDHTPPHSASREDAVQLQSLEERLAVAAEPPFRARHFQRGTKYHSLCARCNDTLLGDAYDPALSNLCTQVRGYVQSVFDLPQCVHVKIKPQRVMRSVLGHMVAQGVLPYRKGPITEPLRDYFLDPAAPLPPPVRLYYWLYPHRQEALPRESGRLRIPDGKVTILWLLKFFPVAFMATFGEQDVAPFDQARLDQFGDRDIDFTTDVPIRLRPIMHPLWPEAPNDDEALMFEEQAVSSEPAGGAILRS
jgi:hypothetical protein